MKFLFRSGWGESLGIARRVESEGNLVRFCVVEKAAQSVGQGLITRTRDYGGSVAWADVVVFDSNPLDMPSEAEKCLRAGKKVVGSSEFAGVLEHDRMKANDIAHAAGIEVPHYFQFKGQGAFQRARTFLQGREGAEEGWVWKQCGKGEVASTWVSDEVDDMLRMLTYFEGLYVKEKEVPDFVLTEKIDGLEISCEAWFNGSEFFLPNQTLECTRFFPGEMGEKTGCAGNVVWCGETPLYDHLFPPLVKALRGKYNGPVDINLLIEKGTDTPIFLEFTPRFGYDAIFALAQLINKDFGGLLADAASGVVWRGEVENKFSGALRIHTPPYPADDEGRAEDIPVFNFDPSKVERFVWPGEIKLDPTGEPVTSGPLGCPFVVGKLADNVKEAIDIKPHVRVPLMRYRDDLPKLLQDDYDDLLETGWLGDYKRKAFGRRYE